jgi:hypothetical protein
VYTGEYTIPCINMGQPSAVSTHDFRVEEEWSPGEIVVDRSAIKTFGSRSDQRQSNSTTPILSFDRALA